MPIYACRVLAQSGALTEKKVEAASEVEARAALQVKGAVVVRVKEQSVEEQAVNVRPRKVASLDETANTARQMSILIRAGVPLVEGLRSLAEQARTHVMRDCLDQITNDVSHGLALSECFARHPGVFPRLAVEMARVAEAGGNLAESMAKLAEHLESSADMRRKIKSAMAYPIVVVCISFVTVLVLVTFIMPRFMKLFDSMGAKIPWTTKAMMSTSHILITRWYLFIIGTIAVVHLLRRYIHSPRGKRKIDSIALKLPIIGKLVHKIVISRVVATMATLLSSGVPMVQTLEISASAADNEVVKSALLATRKHVAEGIATSQAMRATGMFPPMVLQMVTSGEKTGELPSMLNHVCAMYKQETDASVKSLTSIIEPILIVLLGIVVGFIAISVILPIYSLVGNVK